MIGVRVAECEEVATGKCGVIWDELAANNTLCCTAHVGRLHSRYGIMHLMTQFHKQNVYLIKHTSVIMVLMLYA